MLKKFTSVALFIAIFCIVHIASAEEDCVAAVDAADAMNVNQKPCDYTDKGLNGVLHRAFAKKSAESNETIAETSVSPGDTSSMFLLRAQADQWANVPFAKTQLLPQALAQCENGFRIVAEEYRPLKMGKIEVTLQGVCL